MKKTLNEDGLVTPETIAEITEEERRNRQAGGNQKKRRPEIVEAEPALAWRMVGSVEQQTVTADDPL